MRLRPRTREQAFAAIEVLKSPGQKAWLMKSFINDSLQEVIRICHPVGMRYQTGTEITKPEQLEIKEYQIII